MTTLTRRPVTITIGIKSDGPPDFELVSTKGGVPIKKGSSGGNDDVIEFDNWQGGNFQDGFEIEFVIRDDTGKGYAFFQDNKNPQLDDAMAAKLINPNGYCPRPGQTWVGFKPTGLSPDKKTLTVENPNGHRQYFGFAFFFALPGQTKSSLTYDPIGDNKNGEPPRVCD